MHRILPFLFLTLPLHAQFSSDSNLNLSIADRPGAQQNAKLAADGTGGTWIGWFDQASGNYDVYVQHVDAYGIERFPHNGVLVSAHPSNTSLVDWDLLADTSGGCVVTFCDARAGADLDVYAYRIEYAGAHAWGANGVTLSNNADFEAAPRVSELSDGSFVVVWTRAPSPGDNTIRMQKLDAIGVPQFPAEGLAISGALGEDPGFCDVVPSLAGGYIVQWLRHTAITSGTRHLRAQRFDANGSSVWPSFVAVYDAISLPIAYLPVVQPDGAGGAYFAWHRSQAGAYDCLVQHVDANGVEVFPHNGVSVSNQAGVWELEPSLAQVGGGELVIAFHRRNSSQSNWGVGVQKLDSTGALLWGPTGVDLAPLDGVNESFERCVPDGQGGAFVLWFEQPTAIPGTRIRAQRVDGTGNPLWAGNGIEVSSNLSSKDDLEVVTDLVWPPHAGYVRAAWWDLRVDPGNVYTQNLFDDGALGDSTPGSAFCAGDGLDPVVTTACPCGNVGGPGRGCASSFNPLGAALSGGGFVQLDDVSLEGTGMNAAGTCIFLMGTTEDPFGLPFGDGVRCAEGALLRLRAQALVLGTARFPDGPLGTITLSARSGTPVGSGVERNYLVYYRNASAAFCPPETFNATNGYRILW